MRGLLTLNLVLMLGLLQSCFLEPKGEVTELSFEQELGGGMASSAAFEATLHPILVKNCAGCHGDSGSQVKHSSSNAESAHDVVTSRSYANLNNASSSFLVTKVRSNHNCWTNCEADANAIQTAIENWANLAQSPDGVVPFDREASAKVFKDTTHPILLNNCAGCHGDPGTQAPRHALSDHVEAHGAVIDTARVDFGNIPNSRLVKRLSEDEHYCWGDCTENANEMQASIEAWASQIDTSGLTGVVGAKTASLSISQAELRLPETIAGTVVLQAEDAVLDGRYKIKIDAQASGLKMIVGDLAPTHPKEATLRNQSFNGPSGGNSNLCRTVEASHISSGTTGRYRESEQRRHVDQTGHRFYSQLIRANIIRPHLREEFRQALVNGDANLDRFYLRTGSVDPDNPDGPLDGNLISRDITRVLPEFMDHSTYTNSILNATSSSQYADFFAPKHGTSGTEYWNITSADIRAGLSIDVKRREGFDDVRNFFRDIFFDNGFNNPENSVGQIPRSLRSIGNNNFTINNLTESQLFYDTFFRYPGSTTLLSVANANDDMGGGVRRIDTYIHYTMDPADRDFDNFTMRYRTAGGADSQETYNLRNNSNVTLDLLNYYSGGSTATPRQIRINNYGATVKPVFVQNNCFNCHGDGSGRPQFAGNDDEASYDQAAAIGGFFNFSDWSQSRPVVRMFAERHNCGSNTQCDATGTQLQAALEAWDAAVQAEITAAENSQDNGVVELSVKDRTPGRAQFKFKVTEAGDYNVWLKVKTTMAANDDVGIRILDAQGRPMRTCRQNEQCITTDDYFANRLDDAVGCEVRDVNEHVAWEWHTPSIDDFNNRRKWTLPVGEYTLELIEAKSNFAIDLVAVSKNQEFNPRDNLIDEGFIQSTAPKILSYDLQDLIGQPGKFEIEVIEKESGDAYIFRAPQIKDVSSNVRFRDIKLLINNQYNFSNSTYTKLDRIVNGQDSGLITASSLMALHIAGPSTDSFAFVFKDIAATDQAPVAIDEDNPVPFLGRECKNLSLFQNSVMPILNNFKLMFKEDYETYTSDDNNGYPGRNGNGADAVTTYNCTTCHNEDHPYFKMTTFAEGLAPGQPIPEEGLAMLCKQALSRVDFGNFERSLLLRGLNGTFNHPKLHFIQDASISGSGNNRAFNTSTSDPSGYSTQFIGHRFEKWPSGEYRRVVYQTYNDPFAVYDGEIRASNDSITTNANGIDVLNSSGRNLVSDAPESNTDGLFKVKSACVDVPFVTSGGITQDPCNGNANYETEFENLKQKYRDAVINWMQQEKISYDNCNNDPQSCE